ncbi:MAG: ABC transporter substrate-binding protein [Campylobacterota bacterium]|nr:ABC transporter substrate-binding protein [Campylobacterota bacterium]
MLKIIIMFCLLFVDTLLSKNLEKVSLHLQRLDQFQFAGYYIAKEKGFYKDNGLELEIKKFDYSISPVNEVVNKKATYGIGISTLVINKSNGKNIKLLASIFQSSPSVLLAIKDRGIKTISDFKNKRVMFTTDESESAAVHAMIIKHGISKNDMVIQDHSFDINDLINKKTDLMSSYISNEPYALKQKGFEPIIFDSKDYGFDFYSDILFTSDDEIKNHTQRAINFTKASIKGWEYAFNNIEETVELILKKYNSQNKTKNALIFEANELKKLAYYKTKELGHINYNKIQRIYDVYNLMGLIKKPINLDNFIFHDDKYFNKLTNAEKKYLKNKKELTVCVKKGWLPYESIIDGKFVGMSADYLNLYSKKLSIPLKIITANTQIEVLKLLKEGGCDIKPMMGTQKRTRLQYIPTKSQISDQIVLVTSIETPFINDLKTLNKTILMEKGFNRFFNIIKNNYPNIKIKEVDNIDTALNLVASGKEYGYISTSFASAYQIQKKYSTKLKIVNDFKKLQLGIGVIKNEPILLDILNKVISTTTTKEKNIILNNWIAATIEKEKDYTLVWQIIIISLLIIIIFAYWAIKYKKEVQKRKDAETKVMELNYALEYKYKVALKDLKHAQKIAKIGSWKLNINSQKLTWSDETYRIYDFIKRNDRVLEMKDFLSFIYPYEGLEYFDLYNHHLKTKEPYNTIYRIKTRKDNVKWIEERCETTFDEDGNPLVSTGTIQDVTEHKKLELEIQSKDKQMLHQSRLALMGEMISMIAHQWRQPLTAISARVNNLTFKIMMGEELDKELFQKELDHIGEYSQHLSKTIDDFRGFFDKDKTKEVTTLEDIVNSTLNIVQTSVENKNIKIITNFNCKEEFETYPNEIKQVVLNLIKNAEDILIEKELKDPTITIETNSTDKSHKVLIIKDNAGGIPEDIIDNIFDPYFSTKKEKDGTGLGLYMSKTIIEDHCKGRLSVSNDNDGAVFKIVL